jgi:leucyl aminopeptidase
MTAPRRSMRAAPQKTAQSLPAGWLATLPELKLLAADPGARELQACSHVLVLFSADRLASGGVPAALPGAEQLRETLARRRKKPAALCRKAAGGGKMPVAALIPEATLPGGGLIRWLAVDLEESTFLRQQALREAFAPLLAEQPARVDVVLHGSASFISEVLADVAYVGCANYVSLPKTVRPEAAASKTALSRKTESAAGALRFWVGASVKAPLRNAYNAALDWAHNKAEANLLARSLCVLPPNQLTPASFRAQIPALIKGTGIKAEVYDISRLKRLKAGAFLAVAQGSPTQDAAIVHLTYIPKAKVAPRVSLVGKGICFDTGGHNLKPARYMAGMHEDMAGAATALSVIRAAARLQLPVRLDAWLALSRNDISPDAYCQGDIVTALNGLTIEIVHTDAEGRMVLADTLTLATKAKPDVVIDFATLTGSMTMALGNRMSGFFATDADYALQLAMAGEAAGERVMAFAMPDDYDSALESQVADVKQCTLDGEADHTLAARFLNLFVGDAPWLHVDLSAASCKGGLGAVGTETTGFGAALALQFLRSLTQ